MNLKSFFLLLLGISLVAAGVTASSSSIAVRPEFGLQSLERILRLSPGKYMARQHDPKYFEFTQKIFGGLDILGVTPDQEIDLRTSDPGSYARLFESLGFNVTDITDLKKREHEELWSSDPICRLGAEACAAQTADDFYDKYQSLESIHARVDKILREHPQLTTGHSWGRTYEGRDQKGLFLTGTGGGDPERKPMVFWFCGEHAREWIPPMFCTYMAENLAEQYATNSRVRTLMDKYRFAVLPVMNADGYVHSQTQNTMWRKSRKPNPGSSCVGTDLNRNWNYKWNTGGSSGDPCSDVYHGTAPNDNVETQNIYRFTQKYRPLIAMDCHAYGQMWMFAWGYSYSLPSDNAALQKCADAARDGIRSVNGLTFRTGTIANVIYVASGSSVDTWYGEQGVKYAYAAEVRGTSFQPPASNIKLSNAELWEGMLQNVECVDTTP